VTFRYGYLSTHITEGRSVRFQVLEEKTGYLTPDTPDFLYQGRMFFQISPKIGLDPGGAAFGQFGREQMTVFGYVLVCGFKLFFSIE
jgi:hypothetical protein